jgi:AcrR family transcriptional regulator
MAVRLPAQRRRRQLLDVALDVFARGGYHEASMDDVAEAAGVTKPVLYQHFASKRELYLELLQDVGTQLMDAVVDATAAAAGPRAQVEAGFTAYFAYVGRHVSAFRLLFGGGRQADEEFVAVIRRVEETMAEAVAALITADIDEEHRRLLAHGVVGLAEATSRHWVGRGLDLEPDRMAARVAELAWAGLRGIHPTIGISSA